MKRRLPATVWKLGWVSFFADVASEMVYPLIPLFLTGPLGAPKVVLGLVEGVAESVVSFMKGWSGIGSDRRGARVPYIRAGYGLSAIGKPLLGLAYAWPLALVARSVDRVGKGLRTTARDALIIDAVESGQKGEAFGLHRSMDTAGALVGVAIAAAIVAFLGSNLTAISYRNIFLLAAIPGLISVAITFAVKDLKAPPAPGTEKPPLREVVKTFPKPFWAVSAAFAVFSFANSSDTFILIRAKDLGYSTVGAILAYGLYNVAYMLFSYPAGRISDRIGRWPVIACGWWLYAAVYAGLAFLGGSLFPGLLVAYGIYIGLTKAVGTALVADHAPENAKGTAMGVFNMIAGVATIFGNVVAGELWDHYGSATMFLTGAAIAAVAALSIPILKRI